MTVSLNNAFACLIGAVILEACWIFSLKPASGFSRLGPSVLCIVFAIMPSYLLSRTTQRLNTSLVYTIWTSSSAILALALDATIRGKVFSTTDLCGVTLIIVGIALIAAKEVL